jgi:hypothetical protein
MKRLSILAILGLYFLISCDIVHPPFETLPNQNGNTTPTTSVTETPDPTEEDLSGINDEPNYRRAFLEEYTGHQCGNCPRAAETALALHNQYKDKLVTIAIHAGHFARFNANNPKYFYNFKTSDGDALDVYFGNAIAGLPNGLISRIKVNNSFILQKDEWITHVENITKQNTKLKIKIKNEFADDSKTLTSTVYLKNLEELQGEYKIGVAISEDSIMNWQKDYSLPSGQQDIENYAHRHVYRGGLNGTWGETLFENTTAKDTFTKKTFTKQLDANWNTKNCSVIVFVYDAATLEVLQVAESKVLK